MEEKILQQFFNNFSQKKVLIIGDVMVDSYLFGRVDRISPEAPVPVVSVEKRINRLGGAANVALNIHSLGAQPILCSVIGKDERGEDFIDLLKEKNLATVGLIKSKDRKTTTKFRVIGNNVQMLRVDEEITTTLNDIDLKILMNTIESIIENEKIDIIIFEDYDKGCISESLIQFISNLSKEKNIPVTVDPKKNNFQHYKGLTLLKPNFKELKEGTNTDIESGNIDSIANTAHRLMEKNKLDNMMVTLSEHGVLLCEGKNHEHIAAHFRSISDVSGAGDTVISVLSLAMVSGFSLSQAAHLANLAGGLVCEEVGVVPIQKERLFKEAIQMVSI